MSAPDPPSRQYGCMAPRTWAELSEQVLQGKGGNMGIIGGLGFRVCKQHGSEYGNNEGSRV